VGQPRAADAFQCRRRKRVIGNSYAFKPGDLAVPLKECFQRVECGEGSIDDLGPDSVPGMRVTGMGRGIVLIRCR